MLHIVGIEYCLKYKYLAYSNYKMIAYSNGAVKKSQRYSAKTKSTHRHVTKLDILDAIVCRVCS